MRPALVTLAILLVLALPARGQQKSDPPKTHPQSGPATIKVNADVTLKLPSGFLFYNKSDTDALMRYMGNPPSNEEVGLVTKSGSDWFILFAYSSPGHISDSDASQLNADDLLKSFKEGTEQANEERRKMGASPLQLKGWAEQPRYEASSHQLVWALTGQSSDGEVVNYFTRVLGREGLLSMNLVCSPSDLEKNRGDLKTVIDNVSFNPGQAYADFQAGRDRDSGMSLTSLILGGGAAAAAAKLGIFGKLGKLLIWLLIVGKKAIVFIFVAIGAAISKLFNRNKTQAEAPPAADDPGPDA